MGNIYIIVMLCNDDGHKYIDYINKKFNDKDKAIQQMILCASDELKGLKEIEDEDNEYDYVNFKTEFNIYHNKKILTHYEIIEITK